MSRLTPLTMGPRLEHSLAVERTELLERDHELEQLHVALRAVARQAGRTVVIEGAAGVGKSRLVEEARERASRLGMRILTARATELEQGFPFGVIRQLFERLLVDADAEERARWLAGAAALAEEVLIAAPVASSATSSDFAAGDAGYAWQHALYWLASNLCTDSPLALIVDDLQWCDAPSARALSFIGRRLDGQPLALIVPPGRSIRRSRPKRRCSRRIPPRECSARRRSRPLRSPSSLGRASPRSPTLPS